MKAAAATPEIDRALVRSSENGDAMFHLTPDARERSAETGFAGNPLNRLSERRDDADHIAMLRADPTSRMVLIVRDTPVLARRGGELDALFTLEEAAAIGALRETALLGRTPERAIFAGLLGDAVAASDGGEGAGFLQSRVLTISGRQDLAPTDMRSIATQALVPAPIVAVLAQAKSLMSWHARHQFCANCGEPAKSASAGWRRECKACGASHFPRTDPVVIMLATDREQCLLGRQSRFPKGMYSALAGFLEPGETVEDAVRREIREEAGIEVGRVAYVASQPWPFPASLMIGCLAQANTRDVVLDGAELEDARWFDRDELRAMFAATHPGGLSAPHPVAIAHHLLKAWLEME